MPSPKVKSELLENDTFLTSTMPVVSFSPRANHRDGRTCSLCLGKTYGSTVRKPPPKKRGDGYIPRPKNAFILFRMKCSEGRQKDKRQADFSKHVGQKWKSLSLEEHQYWEECADETKKDHEKMYPNYVYRPWPRRKLRSKDRQHTRGGDRATSRLSSKHPCSVQGSLSDIVPTNGFDASGQVCGFEADLYNL